VQVKIADKVSAKAVAAMLVKMVRSTLSVNFFGSKSRPAGEK
jgi:hypothetical protein